ncbi:MAG: winged helix-turn-helix domain-containing protein [Acidimicrobiia bacterium]|nr:winged helix-turn-helix domain-containing protein [Acidimicrobiia bacterium]
MSTNEESRSSSSGLDYEAAEHVHAETPEQLKALGSTQRLTILSLLNERAASVTELAKALGRPKGTVGYHVKVLEDAGFIQVVRTRKVRAMTEVFYGRVAHTVVFHGVPDPGDPLFMVRAALKEAVVEEGRAMPAFTLRHVRMSEEQAAEFWEEVAELADRFAKARRGGDRVYGFLGGIYQTDLPTLPAEPS